MFTRNSAAAVLVGLAMFATDASAQKLPNERTFITFSAPVALPGVTLKAGTYTFETTEQSRHIIRVFNANKRLMGTMWAMPAHRAEVTNTTAVHFYETRAGMPSAVRTWFYPGDSIGHEFMYPKMQAQRILARMKTKRPVLTMARTADGRVRPFRVR